MGVRSSQQAQKFLGFTTATKATHDNPLHSGQLADHAPGIEGMGIGKFRSLGDWYHGFTSIVGERLRFSFSGGSTIDVGLKSLKATNVALSI
jgi:hypothetical protein